MQMFQLTLQLLYPLLLFALPCWMKWVVKYRKRGLKAFFLSVAFRPHVRRFIESVTLLALLALPLLYMRTVEPRLWFLPTIGVIVPLISHRVAEGMLYRLTEPGHFYVASLVVFVCLYVPFLFPVALTLATIMAAAMLYAPQCLVNELRHPSFVSEVASLKSAINSSSRKVSLSKLITIAYERRNH